MMKVTSENAKRYSSKALACLLALTLCLWTLPHTAAVAYADEEVPMAEGDQGAAPSANDQVTADPPDADGDNTNKEIVDGGDESTNQDGSVVDPAPGSGSNPSNDSDKAPDPNAPTNDADAAVPEEEAVLAVPDTEENHNPSTLSDENIASVISSLEGADESVLSEKSMELLSLSGSGSVETFGGATMFETAVKEAKAAYPAGSKTAILAGPGISWVDALASAGLAATKGPILFTQYDKVHDATKKALADLGVKSVIVVGGTAAISNSVVSELKAAGITLEKRLGGVDCYDTQMKIYEYGLQINAWDTSMAIVATGSHYGDALSVSPVAFAKRAPIFLTQDGTLRTPQKKALAVGAGQGKFASIAIVGGTAAISSRTEGYIGGVVRTNKGTYKRLAGATQYETSAEVAKWAVSTQGFTWDNAAFTTGTAPYDALAGSVLQGKDKSVMLLVNGSQSATIKEASTHKSAIKSIRFFGGNAAISPSVRTYIVNCVSDKITYESAGISFSSITNLEYEAAKKNHPSYTKASVGAALNPDQYGYEDDKFFQFAVVDSGYSGKVTAAQLNKFIDSHGSDGMLAGKGQAFIDAAKAHGTNEVYLLAHAILESGWGKSELARGYKYDGVAEIYGKKYPAGTYYNFFGIGAYDDGPLAGGRAAAIQNNWNTPEKAITGAAEWIATGYHNNGWNQNTLYKMRWNYSQAAKDYAVWKQYATSADWATGIASVMANCYAFNRIDKSNTGLKFLVPLYS